MGFPPTQALVSPAEPSEGPGTAAGLVGLLHESHHRADRLPHEPAATFNYTVLAESFEDIAV